MFNVSACFEFRQPSNTMKYQTSSILSRATRVACVALATEGAAMVATQAHAQSSGPSRAVNVYGGIAYGLQVRSGCDGATNCEAGRDAVKLFGGYRMTPNLATEISYFYLGKQDRTWAPGNPSTPTYRTVVSSAEVTRGIRNQEDKTYALGLGVNLETELFSFMTNHLRVGLAYSRTKSDILLDNGSRVDTTKDRIFPYAGVGASALVSPYIRLVTAVDVLLNPDRTHYVITAGISGEF